ncbi:menaquinone biosynthesis decarboxylase [Sulfurimonas sp. MAG313]|nr:menaquinone biosynthesis decarboxylase [Sulfurimonas sp. MAG313]MDF1882146.1 menaquinone biosynthesis decarboxylase [Sulfurimonas sp. MAG313]
MRNTIKLLHSHGELREIHDELDIYLEIPHIAYIEVKKEESKALLFTNVVDRKTNKKFDEPVLMNLFGSFSRTQLLFGRDVEGIAKEIESLLHMKPPSSMRDKFSMLGDLFNLKNIFPKRLKKEGACQALKFLGEDAKLSKLPILTTWEEDGGPFITMGQVYTQSLDGELVNLGMYRLQMYDDQHLGMHWQIHKDSSHFFDQYQREGKKMPVSIAIGGNPLYTWCATAPLPYGVNELLLYGLITKKPARLVKSLTTPLYIPEDVDYVIEGWVDPSALKVEGPFGDHTGYYTLEEPYPVMKVSAITHKKDPVFLATVVGKPPLEDKFMGWATERIFLPLLKTTASDLLDYHMPENGVFHNLILAKMKPLYKGHAKQFMHAFWGTGQMSFVKHAIFVGEDAPRLSNYEPIVTHILNRFHTSRVLITEGITDALDHSSPEALIGGKFGLDCTGAPMIEAPELLKDEELFQKLQRCDADIRGVRQYMRRTRNPIAVISVQKTKPIKEVFEMIQDLQKNLRVIVFVDEEKNDLDNAYMLVWRVVNNIDAQRDFYMNGDMIAINGTNKNSIDGFTRQWPGDVECTDSVLKSLSDRGIIEPNDDLYHKFQLCNIH